VDRAAHRTEASRIVVRSYYKKNNGLTGAQWPGMLRLDPHDVMKRAYVMSTHPTGDQAPPPLSASARGLRALEADFDVVASPLALRMRLLIAAVLGCVFGGVGLIMTLSVAFALLHPTSAPLGNGVGALAIGIAALAVSVVCFKGGLATFRAYRQRGLL